MQPAHHLNVKRFQGVSSRLDEVYTCVDTVIDNIHPVNLVLGVEVGIKPLLDVLNDGLPGIIIIDKVTEAWGINHGKA